MKIFIRNNLSLKVITKSIFSNLMEINYFEHISYTKNILIRIVWKKKRIFVILKFEVCILLKLIFG